MENLKTKKVGEIVAGDYRCAAVFQRNGIEFCCKGNRTLNDACERKGLSADKLIVELNDILTGVRTTEQDYQAWELTKLTGYIVETHHRYIEKTTPVLIQFLDKLCKVHGGGHPELFEINDTFNRSARELAAHMKKEELMLFPAIGKMVAAKSKGERMEPMMFGTVQNPIAMMMQEHETEGANFEDIAKLSNGYMPPGDACATYRAAYVLLSEFDTDLHKHIHLENNILFPKAIELEDELNIAE